MDRLVLYFALDVPQGQVQCPDRVSSFPAGGREEGAIHVLPQLFDMLRVAADQSPCGLFQQVLRSALADAHDSSVGLDGDDHVALIEKGIRVWRQIRSYSRDLHLWKAGKCGKPACCSCDHCGWQGLAKGPTLHQLELL